MLARGRGFWYVSAVMTVYLLPQNSIAFPHPALAEPDGLLAVGGDLAVERLVEAYARGIFPWYCEDTPILWWSPDPRLVLFPAELHVPRSLRRTINSRRFTVTVDAAYNRVVDACADTPRPGQPGTWLLPEMRRAYKRLHREGAGPFRGGLGRRGNLAGGIYGVSLGPDLLRRVHVLCRARRLQDGPGLAGAAAGAVGVRVHGLPADHGPYAAFRGARDSAPGIHDRSEELPAPCRPPWRLDPADGFWPL